VIWIKLSVAQPVQGYDVLEARCNVLNELTEVQAIVADELLKLIRSAEHAGDLIRDSVVSFVYEPAEAFNVVHIVE
jgi:hypothetical protein